MRQKLYQIGLAALIYFLVVTYSGLILIIPQKIINVAIFLPPMFGLMWGLSGVIGVCIGGIFNWLMIGNGEIELLSALRMIIGLFLASYLPYLLWHKCKKDRRAFSLTTFTLKKFIAILFTTFAVTSIFRALTANPQDLELVAGFLGKRYSIVSYFGVCLVNDFLVTIFFDLVIFFILISKNFPFHNAPIEISKVDNLTDEELKALKLSAISYGLFPISLVYLDIYQIYGMEQLSTWINFVAECLTVIDLYLLLIIYLLLRYRRSIMMEIVFMVAMTVFLSSAVLGWGSSVAMSRMVESHVNNSLNAMSVICRERLNKSFFCGRQAVDGMERQAIISLESYDKLVNDATYRKNYLESMKKIFSSIAIDADGLLSCYFRLIPEIEGGKGGFSMIRQDIRWEGSLSPFRDIEPVDISAYDPNDVANVGWYYIPLKSKCATWIEPFIVPTSETYVISYVAPIFIEGKFIGVIGVDIDFNFIIQELRRMSIYDYGYVYLTDRNNVVLYHKDRFQGSIFQHNPEFKEMEIYLTNGMWLGVATPLSRVYDMRNHILMHLVASILIVAMLVSLGSIVVVSHAIKPLEGMTEAAKRIASGDLNVKISYESGNELGLLVRSIREMATKLEVYVYRDKLTGLRNAAAYISKSTELDNQAKLIPEIAYGVILFDVNFLKKVNDNHGHQAGNQLLRHASRVICKVFDHSPVYRVGGDEFVAVLEGEDYENRNELIKLFDEKIAEESFMVGDEKIFVSVARGMGIYEQGKDFASVAKVADVAMYNHKSAIKAKYGEEVR